MEQKMCATCGKTKPLTEFWRRRSGRVGIDRNCKTCCSLKRGATPRFVAPPGMKRCGTCKTVKSVSEFSRNKRTQDGLHWICKICHYGRHKTYRMSVDNRVAIAATRRTRMGQPAVKEAYYNTRMRRTYRLSPDWTYADALARQGGICAICGTDHNPGMFRFALDHCRETGIVRGLLCTLCNQAIGQLKHSPDLLRRAALYLETFHQTQL